MTTVDVLVVGGGPAGLGAAILLAERGRRVTVLERERDAGGVPRHTAHTGFGLRDLRLVTNGPDYAARYVATAARAGVNVLTETTATDWAGPTSLHVTGPAGVRRLDAHAVLLATGCRERSRAARLVPGDRPRGIFTTGSVQQLTQRGHAPIGQRALIVGAEHVSFSVIPTLAHAGTAVVGMVTEHQRDQTFAPLRWLTASRHRVPIFAQHRLTRILGRERVDAVEVTDLTTDAVHRVTCDTVVFTGDWIPDHELARRGDVVLDPVTRGPLVDGGLHTSRRGVFAAGNLLHPAEPADIAALSGRHAAAMVTQYLVTAAWPVRPAVTVRCQPPILWTSPGLIDPANPVCTLDAFILRMTRFCGRSTLAARQGERVLWRKAFRQLVPNRSIRVSARWIAGVDPTGPPVTFHLED